MRKLPVLLLILSLAGQPAEGGVWQDCKGWLAAGVVATAIVTGVTLPIVQGFNERAAAQKVIEEMAESDLDTLPPYFTKKGFVFRVAEDGRPAHVRGISRVQALVPYKNTVVAREEGGSVKLLDPDKREWIEIGRGAEELFASGDDLFLRTASGETKRYQGRPGDIIVSYMPVTTYMSD